MTIVDLDAFGVRKPSVDSVGKQFPSRWSPRAMTGKALAESDLAPLFEAARWAPSSMNAQPWRFIYSLHGDENWTEFYNLLAEGNQKWAKNAGALIVIISSRIMGDSDSVTHSFDSGAAWMSLALQAHQRGLVAHGMQGFDYELAASKLKVPQTYRVEAMAAIGFPGEIEELPDYLQAREKPSNRLPVEEIVFRGTFKV